MHYKNLHWLWLSLAIIFIDQFSKLIVLTHLVLQEPMVVIPHFFNLTLMYNNGAAFSFLAQMSGWQRWFLIATSLIIALFLLKWLLTLARTQYCLLTAISLIIGGAMGNVLDRLRLAQVVDFIQLYYKQYYYPAFNIADSAVVVGVIMIIIYSIYEKKS